LGSGFGTTVLLEVDYSDNRIASVKKLEKKDAVVNID
jgi:hypothetical protein